ncbi:MAG: hypothetical protein Q8R78_00550 [Candidatus Omnitrophota bacterium]|nr:hypothetical protein [Candidatus Omnitrophota bacterium]
MDRQRSVIGIVLIALGVLFLVGQRLDIGGEGVVAVIGLAFLTAYAFTRNYGFLVPGGIMTGLGIGIIYETLLDANGAPVLLGLGLGFTTIYVISRLRERMSADWWPLIPGRDPHNRRPIPRRGPDGSAGRDRPVVACCADHHRRVSHLSAPLRTGGLEEQRHVLGSFGYVESTGM